MKTFIKPLVALGVVAFIASQAMAGLPNQMPPVIPDSGDYGPYATRDRSIPLNMQDPDLAKAYDNFTISDDYVIDGFCWAGLYVEPLPSDPAETDFLIEIWNVDPSNDNLADVHNGPVLTFYLTGGTAGEDGPEVDVTSLGYTGPGNGPAYSYDADVAAAPLAAGDYWISILANQSFASPAPIVDPEWQWHLGTGPGDGFTTFDRTNDPPGTLQSGTLDEGKDLAFQIKGVPEPSSMLMALCGLAPLGLLRRKRK